MGKYFLPNVKNEKGGGGVKGVRSLAAYKTIYILLWYVGDTNFILGNAIIIPLVVYPQI